MAEPGDCARPVEAYLQRPEVIAMSIILVTGALGNIGARVIAKLASAGVRVRALVRRPADAKLDPSVEVVAGSYDDAGALRAAMAGASRALFITAGPELARHDA